jgi:hypothetical protein
MIELKIIAMIALMGTLLASMRITAASTPGNEPCSQ